MTSLAKGRVNNNVIGHSGAVGNFPAGTDIYLAEEENSNMIVEVKGNPITGISQDNGIQTQAFAGSGRIDTTIDGNNITIVQNTNVGHAIFLLCGTSSSTNTNSMCANVKNNNVTPAFNGTSFSLRARATGNGGSGQTFHKLYLQGAGTDVATTWNGNNNLVGAAANAGAVNTTISGTFGTNVFSSTNASPVALATCAVPDNPVPTSIPNLVQENVNGITSNESIAIQDSQSIMSENSGKEAIEKSEIEEN